MSYILDALKKSEEKRKQDPTGTRFTESSPGVTTSNKKKRSGLLLVPFILLGFLFFGALGWFGANYFISEEKVVSTPSPPPPVQPVEKQVVHKEEPTRIPELKPSKMKIAHNVKTWEEKVTVEPKPIVLEENGQEDIAVIDSGRKVPYLKELDVQARASIPELKMAGHVYSPDPSLRLILINNEIKREKDPISAELSLDEITPAGVIFNYNGLLFKIDVSR